MTNDSISGELDAVLVALRDQEKEMAAAAKVLNDLADTRDLKPDEADRLKELTSSLGRVRTRIVFIEAAKLEALDKSDDVKRLRERFTALKGELDAEKARLERLAVTIRNIGKAAAAVEKVVQKLAEIGAKVAKAGI